MRMKLVARDAMAVRMERKSFSNRRLAKYAGCAPGTIDNLLSGKTQALNSRKVAERICEALDVYPIDIFFVPEVPSNARRSTSRRAA